MLSFNFYYDIPFWIFFFLSVFLYRISPFQWRKAILLICSILMLLALPQFSIYSLLFLFGVSLPVFIIGYILNKGCFFANQSAKILFTTATIIFIIFILSFFKSTALQGIFHQCLFNEQLQASDAIFLIGISYSSFKMMHFIIECYTRKIQNLHFLNFLNYIFYFPAFISGPINRYNQFCEDLSKQNNKGLSQDLKSGTERIIHGLFKKFVLSMIVYPYAIINMNKSILEISAAQIIIGLYAYTLYFYFDFSGYSDIAIGSAKIIGIRLPENFNNPFIKKNLQQLWANWHISLTSWLTDYIYWPLSKKLRNFQFLKSHPILLSNVSIIVTFIVCGIWHGETINFVIWGLYHGTGLAILNLYQNKKRKIRNTILIQYFLSKFSKSIGIFITFNFFSFGIIFFSLDIYNIKLLLFRFYHFFNN